MGVSVKRESPSRAVFEARSVNLDYLLTPDYKARSISLRGSVMIVGPLLARFGKAFMPKPGGDKIGRRRLDTHFTGFRKLGASFDYDASEPFF